MLFEFCANRGWPQCGLRADGKSALIVLLLPRGVNRLTPSAREKLSLASPSRGRRKEKTRLEEEGRRNIRCKFRWLLGIYERLCQLHCHLFDRSRPIPLDMSLAQMPLCLRNLLLFDVRADTQTLDAIRVVEVVFQVKLVDVEGHDELHEIGWEVGCPHHGEGKVGSRNVIGMLDLGMIMRSGGDVQEDALASEFLHCCGGCWLCCGSRLTWFFWGGREYRSELRLRFGFQFPANPIIGIV